MTTTADDVSAKPKETEMGTTTTTSNDLPPIYPITRNGEGQLVHQTPEALHPGMIKGNSAAAKQSQSVLADLSHRLAGLNARWTQRDRTLVDEVRQYNGDGIGEARANTIAEIKHHEDKLTAASGFKPDPVLTSLVVGTFQGMPSHERASAVAKLIEQRDGATLAILDSVSNVYTGLTDELKATIRPRLYAAADACSCEAWKTAKANLAAIERASLAMIDAMSRFSKMPDIAALKNEGPARSVAHGFAAA